MDFHGIICEKMACNRGDVDSYIRSSSPSVLELLEIIHETKGSDEMYLICKATKGSDETYLICKYL